ncbi:MAG: beta-phosphoglucomutase [Oscillospiraceae bacterium]|jgi:beta-phosphoglucomutase|nr:beta-phosphoglucomutase [Oscillospiraceae bacterium]
MEIQKAVIFDLDGVIVHTDIYHYRAWKELADRLGVPFDETANNRLRGVSRMESLEIILENGEFSRLPATEKAALADRKNETYKALLQAMSPADLSPEVRGTLETLRKQGVRMAIGSSSRNAGLILEKIGLEGFFDAVSDGNNITNSKPDPEVFLKAAGFLCVRPQDCIVVEDADAGIEAAHRAGMKAVAMGDAVRAGRGDWNIAFFPELLSIFL